jgi:hypothetical protein
MEVDNESERKNKIIKWKYTAYLSPIRVSIGKNNYGFELFGSDASILWKEKSEDGKTSWNHLSDLGENGWELISVTPIAGGGDYESGSIYTDALLFTFKKPEY